MTMKHSAQYINKSRRRLLGGAVGLSAAGIGLGSLGMAVAKQTASPEAPAKRAGSTEYHETDHIRRYYRTAW